MSKPTYKRILLKISGEALAGSDNYGINKDALAQIASDIKSAHDLGVQIGLVVGAGNIFRGVAAAVQGMDRSSADYMGMLATVINCLALSDALENLGLETRVQTAIAMDVVAEPFICRRAIRHLEKGRIVIFAAGTGNPYVTTDSAAALRANEIGAEVVIKATKVDGIYDKDPAVHEDAKMYHELGYNDVISQDLKVMDATAITMCRDNNMPIITFNLTVPGNITRILQGEKIGTIVRKL